jgi:hypothetical protein
VFFLRALEWGRFHKLVTACFCPTKDVAERALKAGLRPSQLRVHGLPIRPSFATFSRPKVRIPRPIWLFFEHQNDLIRI